MEDRLKIVDLRKAFGGVVAVNVDQLVLNSGEIVGLIGPNGAGKSTLIDCVTGFVRPDTGQVTLNGNDVGGARPDILVQHGLTRTFQLLELFEDVPVRSHLDLFGRTGLHAERLIDRLGLAVCAERQVAELSHGQRQMVSLARALCTEPSVLLLDEPASGLDGKQRLLFQEVCREFADAGGSAMVIDHDMRLIFDLCDRIYVLAVGELIAEGAPNEITSDRRVIEAYLGGTDHAVEVLETGA